MIRSSYIFYKEETYYLILGMIRTEIYYNTRVIYKLASVFPGNYTKNIQHNLTM